MTWFDLIKISTKEAIADAKRFAPEMIEEGKKLNEEAERIAAQDIRVEAFTPLLKFNSVEQALPRFKEFKPMHRPQRANKPPVWSKFINKHIPTFLTDEELEEWDSLAGTGKTDWKGKYKYNPYYKFSAGKAKLKAIAMTRWQVLFIEKDPRYVWAIEGDTDFLPLDKLKDTIYDFPRNPIWTHKPRKKDGSLSHPKWRESEEDYENWKKRVRVDDTLRQYPFADKTGSPHTRPPTHIMYDKKGNRFPLGPDFRQKRRQLSQKERKEMWLERVKEIEDERQKRGE